MIARILARRAGKCDPEAVFTAGFTPIPYKVFTIAGGVFRIDVPTFLLASVLSRSARFFAVASLFFFFGPPIKRFIDRYFNLLAIAFTVLLIGGSLVFAWYALLTRKGRRKWLIEMFPVWGDVRDAVQSVLYYLGKAKEKPRSRVFGYVEKSEYWALIWGTAIMVVTGFILWFPKWLPANWPTWLIEVARLIHFYEAVLAASAIVVWHFFHTVFHPSEYPMDTSWLTGKLTEREAEHRFTPEAIDQQRPPARSAEEPVEPESPEWQDGSKKHD